MQATRIQGQSQPVALALTLLIPLTLQSRSYCNWWMFTGGLYLVSVLHFAPAEPPLPYTRVLMATTHIVPAALILIYVLGRSHYEPSPLNLISVPYYWFIGDKERANYLRATQVRCWFTQANVQRLEAILDYPNFAFAVVSILTSFGILNLYLF